MAEPQKSTRMPIMDSGNEVRTKLVTVFPAAELSLVLDLELRYSSQYYIICVGDAVNKRAIIHLIMVHWYHLCFASNLSKIPHEKFCITM